MYQKEFLEAAERASSFGLPVPPFVPKETQYLTKTDLERLRNAIKEEMGVLGEEEVFAQCLSLHMRIKPLVEDIFDCPVLYTIGWVNFENQSLFKQTEQSLKVMLETGIPGPEVSLHAWLTLPSMEILDFSLGTTISKVYGLESCKGAVLTMHPSLLTDGLMYRPMLVGEEFLIRTGAMKLLVTLGN